MSSNLNNGPYGTFNLTGRHQRILSRCCVQLKSAITEHIDSEDDMATLYFVTSFTTVDISSMPRSFDSSGTAAPTYRATSQSIYLDPNEAQAYAAKTLDTLLAGLADVRSIKEKSVPVTSDPSLPGPAFVIGALQMSESALSVIKGAAVSDRKSTKRSSSKSFHAEYPGQRPRLSTGSDKEETKQVEEASAPLKRIVGVAVIPMQMALNKTGATMMRQESRETMGWMKRDIVEELIVEFRGLVGW